MASIALFSASHCGGDEVAGKVAAGTGARLMTDKDLVSAAASRFQTAPEMLWRSMCGPRSVFDRVTRERERALARLRFELGEMMAAGPFVLHGYSAHLVPGSLTHVLKACMTASTAARLAAASALAGVGPAGAGDAIAKEDEARAQWTLHLFGLEPWDPSLYGIMVRGDEEGEDGAAGRIAEAAAAPGLAESPATARAVADFRTASAVTVALGDHEWVVEVAADGGEVTVTIHRFVTRLAQAELEIRKLAAAVPGVRTVRTRTGPHYGQPGHAMGGDRPGKILLVDDEKEFVQTLSERLATRNMESAVAYDGDSALEVTRTDAPDVVVLDLRMPGLGGLEVLRRMKQDHPATEVIVLTGHGSEAEERTARELGAYAYMRKPANVDELANILREAYQRAVGQGRDQ